MPRDCRSDKKCFYVQVRDNQRTGTDFTLSSLKTNSVIMGVSLIRLADKTNQLETYYCTVVKSVAVLPSPGVDDFKGKADDELYQCTFTRPYDKNNDAVNIYDNRFGLQFTTISKDGFKFQASTYTSSEELDLLENGSERRIEPFEDQVSTSMVPWGMDVIQKFFLASDVSKNIKNALTTTTKPYFAVQTRPKDTKDSLIPTFPTFTRPTFTTTTIDEFDPSIYLADDPTCVDKTPDQCPAWLCKMPGPKKQVYVAENCRKTCNLCHRPIITTTTPTPTTTEKPCVDVTPTLCSSNICTSIEPKAQEFAYTNCQRSCGFCKYFGTTPVPTTTVWQPRTTKIYSPEFQKIRLDLSLLVAFAPELNELSFLGNEDAAGEVEIQPIEIKPLTLETPDESNALAGKEKSEEFEICKDRILECLD